MTRELQALVRGLGGPECLLEVLEDFYDRMAADVMIGFFFNGKDPRKIAANQQQLILKAAGLIPEYRGKSPADAHLSLPPILAGHFDRRLQLLRETLADRGVPDELAQNWIRFESAFRKVVVS